MRVPDCFRWNLFHNTWEVWQQSIVLGWIYGRLCRASACVACSSETRNCSMVAHIKNFKLSIDNWLPGFSRDYRYWSPVHYLIPGVLYQPVPSRYLTKSRSREAMEGFASNCVTPFGQSFPSNTSTGQLAAKTLSPKKRIKKRDKKKDRRRHIISQSL